jgi:spoIIIJ-associated protein
VTDQTEELEVEASGETVGEAKWSALRELERRYPGLDRESVELVVLSEGERGLLGVGQVPARVVARITEAPARDARPTPVERAAAAPAADESEAAGHVRELLERVCDALGSPATIAIVETDEGIDASLSGSGLGLLIGRRGQTIDAIQYLANAMLQRSGETRRVIVDAAGYRSRRQETLERAADRAAADALTGGRPVALEPMSAVERKIVHQHLHDRGDVETASEGAEPSRCVVVRPANPDEQPDV